VLATPVSPPPTLAQLDVIMYHTTAVTRRLAGGFFQFEYAVKSKKEEKKINVLRMSV